MANFINLLEPKNKNKSKIGYLFVAESFRSELPPGFSNLYRVDALPALRARLKGDISGVHSSGLAAFETALQNLVGILQQNRGSVRSPRVLKIVSQIQPILISKIYTVSSELKSFDDKQNSKIEIKKKAVDLISKGFKTSIFELRDWLSLPKLVAKYQAGCAVAMAENNFKSWQINTLKKDVKNYN